MELFDWTQRLKDSIRWIAVGVVSLAIDTAVVSLIIKAIRFLRTGLSLVSCIKHITFYQYPHTASPSFTASFTASLPHPSHIAPLLQSLHRARRDRAELHLRLWLIAQREAIKHSLQIGTSGHLDLLERHEVSIFQLQGPQRRVVPKQKTLRLLKRPHAQLDILQIRTV